MFSYSEALISLWIIFQIDYCCNIAFLFHLSTQHQYNFRDITSSQHSCYAIYNNLWLLNNSFKEICTDLIWGYSHLLQEKPPHTPFIFSEKKIFWQRSILWQASFQVCLSVRFVSVSSNIAKVGHMCSSESYVLNMQQNQKVWY